MTSKPTRASPCRMKAQSRYLGALDPDLAKSIQINPQLSSKCCFSAPIGACHKYTKSAVLSAHWKSLPLRPSQGTTAYEHGSPSAVLIRCKV